MRVLTICSDTVDGKTNQHAQWSGYSTDEECFLYELGSDLTTYCEAVKGKIDNFKQ